MGSTWLAFLYFQSKQGQGGARKMERQGVRPAGRQRKICTSHSDKHHIQKHTITCRGVHATWRLSYTETHVQAPMFPHSHESPHHLQTVTSLGRGPPRLILRCPHIPPWCVLGSTSSDSEAAHTHEGLLGSSVATKCGQHQPRLWIPLVPAPPFLIQDAGSHSPIS